MGSLAHLPPEAALHLYNTMPPGTLDKETATNALVRNIVDSIVLQTRALSTASQSGNIYLQYPPPNLDNVPLDDIKGITTTDYDLDYTIWDILALKTLGLDYVSGTSNGTAIFLQY